MPFSITSTPGLAALLTTELSVTLQGPVITYGAPPTLLRFELPSSRHYQTVAGFLLSQFGRIPEVGDHIEVEGWRFEIIDLDGRRIDKILATKISEASVLADA